MHISPARVFVVAAALALLCDVMEYVPEGGREGFALAVRGALEPRSGRLAIITNRELAEGAFCKGCLCKIDLNWGGSRPPRPPP